MNMVWQRNQKFVTIPLQTFSKKAFSSDQTCFLALTTVQITTIVGEIRPAGGCSAYHRLTHQGKLHKVQRSASADS
jgi:hypothetical protein